MVEAERRDERGIWIIPEDTIVTYFQMRWWDYIRDAIASQNVGPYTIMRFVEDELTELLTPSARVALRQVGSTQTVYAAWSNAREAIRTAIPWPQRDLFDAYSSL